MLPKHLSDLILDLQNGLDISAELKQIFQLPPEKLSREHRLKFANQVVGNAADCNSESAHLAFMEAISAMRELVPFLKKRDSPLANTIAAVEKYSVNHASFVLFEGGERTAALHASVSSLTEDSLRLICEARSSPPKRGRRGAQPRGNGGGGGGNENEPPNACGDVLTDDALETAAFKGAAKLGLSALTPRDDAGSVAVVVLGILVSRLALSARVLDLLDLLSVVKQLVAPWLRCLRSLLDGPGRRFRANYDSYEKRTQLVLFGAAREEKVDELMALRVRAYALTFCDVKLKPYARDLLISAQSVMRSKSAKLSDASKYRVVADVYDEALRFVNKFELSDKHWYSENVSAWLDHVLAVWCRRPDRPPLPDLYGKRITALRKLADEPGILSACDLQCELISAGIYQACARSTKGLILDTKMSKALEKEVSKLQLESISTFVDEIDSGSNKEEFRDSEARALNRLRTLRVLEPVRNSLCENNFRKVRLSRGALAVFDSYVAALLDGLRALARFPRNDEMCMIGGIWSRLVKATAAAVEAGKEVLRYYLSKGRRDSIGSVSANINQLLLIHETHSEANACSWKKGMCCVVHTELSLLFESARSAKESTKTNRLTLLADVADDFVSEWFPAPSEDTSFSSEICGLWSVARNCNAMLGDWSQATRFSARVYLLQLNDRPKHSSIHDCASLQRAGHCFVEDACLAVDAKEPLELQLYEPCSSGAFMHAVMDFYSCKYSRLAGSSGCKNVSHELDLLRIVRKSVLESSGNTELAGVCIQNAFHLSWVSALSSTSNSIDFGLASQLLSDHSSGNCRGHLILDFTSRRKKLIQCSAEQISFLKALARSMLSVQRHELEEVGDSLRDVSELLPNHEGLRKNVELMCFAFEILEWIGTALTIEDNTHAAGLAFDTAAKCRGFSGISVPPVQIHSLYVYLANTTWCREISFCPPFTSTSQTYKGQLQEECLLPHSERSSDLASLVDVESKNLKTSLVPLMSPTPPKRPGPRSCMLAGVYLNLSQDVRSVSGQAHLYRVLLLLESLYRYGRVLLSAENLADGRYYLERCCHIASLLLPARCLFLQAITAVNVQECSDIINDDALTVGFCDDHSSTSRGSHSSRLSTLLAILIAALELISQRLASCIEGEIASQLLYLSGLAEKLANRIVSPPGSSAPFPPRYDIAVWKGVTLALTGNTSEAIEVLEPITEFDQYTSPHAKVTALYFLAQCLIQKGGGVRNLVKNTKSETEGGRKVTRRSARTRAGKRANRQIPPDDASSRKKIQTIINRAVTILDTPNGWSCPQEARRVWRLHGLLCHSDEDSIDVLARSVGMTFDVRRKLSLQAKATRMNKQNIASKGVEEIQESLQGMSIFAEEPCGKALVSRIQRGLDEHGSVVLGLNLDETKTFLIAWRISPNGTTRSRLPLPHDEDNSYDAIDTRIKGVITEMKARAVKVGDQMTSKEKQEWWEHRHSLDADVEKILSDIESLWFGSERSLFVPAIFSRDVISEHVSPGGCLSSESLKRLSCAAFPELEGLSDNSSVEDFEAEDLSDADYAVGELILIVDTALECVPWESLPVLRKLSVGVTRAPSLSYLDHQLQQPANPISSNSLFYVVNPGGDLQRTEDTFRDLFATQPWNGSLGNISKEQVSSDYNDERIYLYCGHGAGDQYLSPRRFSKRGEAPVALLMGCSSVRPINSGMKGCESNSAAIDYLTYGSRAVLGNLWDVGDKDIDRFTASVLSLWLGAHSDNPDSVEQVDRLTLAEAVAASRNACRLPYLVGSAAVVMGTPKLWTAEE